MKPQKLKRKNSVTVTGLWFPMPVEFLLSRACASLSPHAAKMLLDLCSQLKANGYGNGDLSAAPAVMRPRGWSSNDTRRAALAELIRAGLLVVTRQGGRRRCTLYAITLWPLQCPLEKLDHGPGCYTTQDWRAALKGEPERVSDERPACWTRTRRENTSPCTATGQAPATKSPARDKRARTNGPYGPATDARTPESSPELAPPGDTYLEMPSAEEQAVKLEEQPTPSTATAETVRVREQDLDPALFDPTTGEHLPSENRPQGQRRAEAQAWVASALQGRARRA